MAHALSYSHRRPVLAVQALAALGLAGYTAYSFVGFGGPGVEHLFEDWIYNALLALAALLCLLRVVLVRVERAPWLLLGIGLSCWTVGEIVYTAAPGVLEGAGFPSVVDLLWLAFYPCAYAALVLLVRVRVDRFYASLWLDGLVSALALSSVVATFVFPPLLAGTDGSLSALVADLAYPAADLVLLAFVLWVVALTGWRPGSVLAFVTAGLLVGAVADGFSLWSAAAGEFADRSPLDWLWPASTLLLVYAAWRPGRPSAVIRLTGLRPLAIPALWALTALAVLLVSRMRHVDAAGFGLASGTLAAVVVRMAFTFAENLKMAERSRHEAITDALTGLGNRRLLLTDLRETLQSCTPESPRVLLTFDLDGFKRYNDTFGHPAGDALLARLGSRLQAAVAAHGDAYRLGGDEFCALVRAGRAEIESISALAELALCEHGRGFSITTSCGSVVLPAEADDETLALQVADKRLYADKGVRRRAREGEQTAEALRQVLQEREPKLDEHLDGVAALARPLGRRFGLSADEVDVLTRAAELHDVGKVAIPDEIMAKTLELDGYETALVQQHTLIGERILGAAAALRPVAKVVRSTHERYDGKGYPDGLGGEQIPLAARIVAVCDAYDVMTTGRPYQARIDHEEAIAELRRCAGSQFDPDVVDALCQEVETLRARGANHREMEAA
jgi:two-component system cell cycle response regulator